MVGETVEHRLDHLVIGDRAGRGAEPHEKGAAERVAAEQPVQITARYPAIGADRAVGASIELDHWPRETRAGRHAEMHLVAAHRRAGRDIAARDLGEPLAAAEYRFD